MTSKMITENLISWAEYLEDAAMQQALRTSRLSVLAGPVALMADAHYGIGATVGSVVATEGAILPSAVGVDIGCGMAAVETNLVAGDLPDDLTRLHSALRDVIPAGTGKGHEAGKGSEPLALRQMGLPPASASELSASQRAKIAAQFGTLGSGNHFVELCVDERDTVWLVLHSGSRGIGNQLGSAHIKTARLLAGADGVALEDKDLAWLIEGRPEFDAYVADMLWCQDYAAGNREQMSRAAMGVLGKAVSKTREVQRIDCHHNYAVRETHFGKEVWVTRKGAIRAEVGDTGIIPGSMGAASFIVRGRGCQASYCSASHGAGRRLGRKQAKRTLSVESLAEAMGSVAWDATMAAELVDEHPAAYKDVRAVMAAQDDLVEVVHELHAVLNMKGT